MEFPLFFQNQARNKLETTSASASTSTTTLETSSSSTTSMSTLDVQHRSDFIKMTKKYVCETSHQYRLEPLELASPHDQPSDPHPPPPSSSSSSSSSSSPTPPTSSLQSSDLLSFFFERLWLGCGEDQRTSKDEKHQRCISDHGLMVRAVPCEGPMRAWVGCKLLQSNWFLRYKVVS